MYASFQAFQTALGVGICSRTAVESEQAAESELAVAVWSCGCSACGIDETCMLHLPCLQHARLWTEKPAREGLAARAEAER